MTSTITSKGQATIPKEIRTQLRLKSGDTVKWFIDARGRAFILPATDIKMLRGIVKYEGKPVSLEEMEEAIAEGATERYRRVLSQK